MNMIEKVARAMAENAGFKWEHCAQSQWRSDARAGIEAMREPTAAMIRMKDGNYRRGLEQSGYRAMIDAALADGQSQNSTGTDARETK